MQQAERAAEHFLLAALDSSRLLDSVRCLHTALTAAMTAALNGSAGVGALDEKRRRRAIEAMDRDEWNFEERTLEFSGLLAALQEEGRLERSQPLLFTAEELRHLRDLNALRTTIDHPKPTSWSIWSGDIADTLRIASSVIPKIQCAGGSWRGGGMIERLNKAVTAISGSSLAATAL